MASWSKNLTFDFPLPAYAAEQWPPDDTHRWYVEIIDNSGKPSTEAVATVREVTLVRRRLGTLPVSYRPSMQHVVMGGGTVKIYVPTNWKPMLTLKSSQVHAPADNPVVLSGTLILTAEGRVVPLKQYGVTVYEMVYDPIEQNVAKGMVGIATTDSQGRYSLTVRPHATVTYQANATRSDSTAVTATSGSVKVTVP